MIKKLLILFLVINLLACSDSNVIYHEIIDTQPEGWKPEDIVRFSSKISDTSTYYNVYVYVRHNTDYSWRNLFLFLKTYYPNHTNSGDTLECGLAEVDGKWIGAGMGFTRHNEWLLKKVKFPQIGTYIFEFAQGMRDEKLKGIESIGMKIVESIE